MYLGLDIGTSGVKALVIDADQKVVASKTANLTVARPASGWSEQEPSDWLSACTSAIGALASDIDLSAIGGIGLSGQMHGATLLNAAGDVLRPCILWNDTRSHKEAAALDEQAHFREVTGNIVFPGFTAPKLLWVRDNEPEILEQTAKVLLPKDYVRYWLTGEFVSDMSDAAGTSWLDTGARDWSDPLLNACDLTRDHMPSLVEGNAPSGELRADLARQLGLKPGIQVAGGAGDNAASAIGMGVLQGGQAFVSLGTSGVLFAANDGYAPDPGTALHTFCHAVPGRWHQMGVILAASDALSWYGAFVGEAPENLTSELGPLHGPGRGLFLPYLGGERTPHNDARVRGALLGIEHGTDRAAGTRAVLEGVAYALADSAFAMKETGTEISSLIAVGGGARSRYWLELMASVLGMPVALPADGDFGAAFGAARLGMMAVDQLKVSDVTPPAIATTFEPDTKLVSSFEEGHARYRAAYAAIKEIS